MELGSWAIISEPTLLGLLPLVVMVGICMKGYNTVSGGICGIIVGCLLCGQGVPSLANAFKSALGTSTSMICLIIMVGAGLGVLMEKTGVAQTLVYWIVKRINVNTRGKAVLALIICSILICGLLGTLGGGNAIIAPVILPVMASMGLSPTVVTVLLKTAGEIGLVLGPLTGVTLLILELTGISYGQYLAQAALPYCAVWMLGTLYACKKTQKRLESIEVYELDENMKHIDDIAISSTAKRRTSIFLITFFAMIAYGFATGQGTNYALGVMIVLCVVLTIISKTGIDEAVKYISAGVGKQANIFLTFLCMVVMLELVKLGGGFEALSELLGGLGKQAGATGVFFSSSVVGGFGIEATAVAEIQIISDMFGGLAREMGLPMGCFATAIITCTRLTNNFYPNSNLTGQMGTARCTNLGDIMKTLWIAGVIMVAYVVLYGFVAPRIF